MKYIEQKKENSNNVIILRYAALYYYWMWITLILSFAWWSKIISIPTIIVAICWLMFLGLAVPYWPTLSKLKKMMREKGISAKGSKYSLVNPLTYEWKD